MKYIVNILLTNYRSIIIININNIYLITHINSIKAGWSTAHPNKHLTKLNGTVALKNHCASLRQEGLMPKT